MTDRFLIVNADDFGQSDGINDGVGAAYERGIVTSASLMVRWPAADHAAAYARSRPALSLGLHVDLAQWTYSGAQWAPDYLVVDVDDEVAVERELSPGWSELGCHPGLHDDAPAGYRTERSIAVAVLCDARLRAGIAERGVELRSFADLAARG